MLRYLQGNRVSFQVDGETTGGGELKLTRSDRRRRHVAPIRGNKIVVLHHGIKQKALT
jgi:hypothetical protein